MATPAPSEHRAAPHIAPARGLALALGSALLVVSARVLDAVVYLSTFSQRFVYVDWRSPLIIAAPGAAPGAARRARAGALVIGLWENRRADQPGTTHRLRAGLARASSGVGLLTLVAIAGLSGSICYVTQACSAFSGCE